MLEFLGCARALRFYSVVQLGGWGRWERTGGDEMRGKQSAVVSPVVEGGGGWDLVSGI